MSIAISAGRATQIAAQKSTERYSFTAIEAKRKALGISLSALLTAADVAERTWDYIRAGHVQPQRRTMVKLERALERIGAPSSPPPQIIAAFWKSTALYLARELDADPMEALRFDGPSCVADAAWMRAARARQLALYLTHVEFSLGISELAHVLGQSKQRVHKAIGTVEDLRDDPELDALLERTAAAITGRASS